MSELLRYAAGGIEWSHVAQSTEPDEGEFDAPCPCCGPERHSNFNRVRRVLRIWRSEPDFATYFCARCGVRGWVKPEAGTAAHRGAISRAFDPPRIDAKREKEEQARRVAFGELVFVSAGQVKDTLAERYLAGRKISPGEDLRFSALAPFAYDKVRAGPAMIAGVRNTDGAIIGAHVTHLNPDGSKMRRTCFGRVAGGAVRLAPIAQDGQLAIAEGIETALSFTALYQVPCWAALSANGIEQFRPPSGLSRLMIAADNDLSGRGLEAAQRLARRAREECEVVISMPKAGDWNNVHCGDGRRLRA